MILKQYNIVFLVLVHKNSLRKGSKALGIFATLSSCSDTTPESTFSSGSSARYICSYKKILAEKHFWKPKKYLYLEFIITRLSSRKL